MTIQIFYPEQLMTLNLSEAIEWHFENWESKNCTKEEADRLIVTFPDKKTKSGLTINGPELYMSPFHGRNGGYVTEESWNKL